MNRDFDEIASFNQKRWERAVKNPADPTTKPWLDIDRNSLHDFAEGRIKTLGIHGNLLHPNIPFQNVKGKDTLLLAGGGGQQSAMFGLLGANVTVFDLCKGQLEGDQIAAKHYGYEVTTIQGDMRDLSVFEDNTFDIVYQPISLSYIDDVYRVFAEVARVLKPKGLYRVEVGNPAVSSIEEDSWDGEGYRLTSPYKGGRLIQDEKEWGIQYCHLFRDVFNGIIQAGLIISGVWENQKHIEHPQQTKPGEYNHYLMYVARYFEIHARKLKIV